MEVVELMGPRFIICSIIHEQVLTNALSLSRELSLRARRSDCAINSTTRGRDEQELLCPDHEVEDNAIDVRRVCDCR